PVPPSLAGRSHPTQAAAGSARDRRLRPGTVTGAFSLPSGIFSTPGAQPIIFRLAARDRRRGESRRAEDRRRRRLRPTLLALEDRKLLSTLVVETTPAIQ